MNGEICKITGVNYNNPEVCVKGTNYGCVCPKCSEEMQKRLQELSEELKPPGLKRETPSLKENI